tara:strand:- start:447 stop:1292 length:846 start_codon:yes stop_codon:yes gene_type:complete
MQFKYFLYISFIFLLQINPATSACPDIDNLKVAESFGVQICAMPNVDQKFVDHAKNVMDKLIDYNDDGLVDNQAVVDKVITTGSVYAVFKSGRGERKFEDVFWSEEVYDEFMPIFKKKRWDCEGEDEDKCMHAVESKYGTFLAVFTNEMNLSGNGWDPTIEEGLHLLTHMGYAHVYPEIFGQNKDSQIAKLMDVARGGYFEKARRNYPHGAYYTYDDRSCTYSCQITEFTYWAITSLRGQQEARDREIREEWKLSTPNKMQEIAPDLVTLLSDSKYGIYFN